MKYLKIAAIVFAIGLFLEVYAYINLMVSYKYEIQNTEFEISSSKEMSDIEKAKAIIRFKNREKEIVHQQKITRILFWVFLVGLVTTLYFYYAKKRKLAKNNDT